MNYTFTLSEAVNVYHQQKLPELRNYIDQLAIKEFTDGTLTREGLDLLLLELSL